MVDPPLGYSTDIEGSTQRNSPSICRSQITSSTLYKRPTIPDAGRKRAYRSIATKAQPTLAQPKSSIPDEKPQQKKREPRQSHKRNKHLVTTVWIGIIGVFGFYCLASLIYDGIILSLSDPATYGPAHGNVVKIVDNGQSIQVYGINDQGHIEMIVVPQNDPKDAHICLGPQNVPTNIEVDLQVTDLNHDGHPDIIMQLKNTPTSLFFPRPIFATEYWISDGNGNYQLQHP